MKQIDVFGYGETLAFHQNTGNTTIGFNHICAHKQCDYVLILDRPYEIKSKEPDHYKQILKSRPNSAFLVFDNNWNKLLRQPVINIGLAKERSSLEEINSFSTYYNLPYSYNSAFVACVIAYRMGATQINIWGCDFNTNTDANVIFNGRPMNEINIDDFRNLYEVLSKNGCKMFVGKKQSRLSEFIPVLTKTKNNHGNKKKHQ